MNDISRRMLLGASAAAFASRGVWAADGPIRIGYVGPLSGSLSLLGSSVRDGLSVAVTAINEKGGVGGRKLELIAEDDGYDPARTVAAGRKLAEQDKVVAIVAPAGTAGTAALLPFITDNKVPLLFPYAFSHALTNPTKRYAFTTLPEVRVQMAVLGSYIVTELKQTQDRRDLPERRFRPGRGGRAGGRAEGQGDHLAAAAVRPRDHGVQRRGGAGQAGGRGAYRVPRHSARCGAGDAGGEQDRLEAAVQRAQCAVGSADVRAGGQFGGRARWRWR